MSKALGRQFLTAWSKWDKSTKLNILRPYKLIWLIPGAWITFISNISFVLFFICFKFPFEIPVWNMLYSYSFIHVCISNGSFVTLVLFGTIIKDFSSFSDFPITLKLALEGEVESSMFLYFLTVSLKEMTLTIN